MRYKLALAAVLYLSTWSRPALAGDFENGCNFYKAKDFKSAQASFERVVVNFPKFALGHYYLGNSLLSLGSVPKAKAEYQLCIETHPDPVTEKYCQDVLAKLGKSSPSSGSSPSSTSPQFVAAAAEAVPDAAPETEGDKQKKAIMSKAEAEIAALRADCQRRLNDGDVNVSASNRYSLDANGRLVHHYAPEIRAMVEGETEEQCKQIKYMAEQRCKFIK